MATQKSPGEDAKTLDDSKDSAPNASTASVAKSNGPKPNKDETRERAYEIFQARQGGPGSALGDWQKAEAAPSADSPKIDASKGAQIPADTGTIQEALTKFHSSIEHGLTQEEAASRLKKDGPNAIEEKRISPLKRFLTFLWGPIPWMIELPRYFPLPFGIGKTLSSSFSCWR
jgi:magnesium-transporting ATPase (P-type)